MVTLAVTTEDDTINKQQRQERITPALEDIDVATSTLSALLHFEINSSPFDICMWSKSSYLNQILEEDELRRTFDRNK